MADGYKDVVLESSARFDLDSPLKMQGDDDDVNEITNGTDLVLNYDINNASHRNFWHCFICRKYQ